jgi:hypothetical protein
MHRLSEVQEPRKKLGLQRASGLGASMCSQRCVRAAAGISNARARVVAMASQWPGSRVTPYHFVFAPAPPCVCWLLAARGLCCTVFASAGQPETCNRCYVLYCDPTVQQQANSAANRQSSQCSAPGTPRYRGEVLHLIRPLWPSC